MIIYGFIKERCEYSYYFLKFNMFNECFDFEINKVYDKN